MVTAVVEALTRRRKRLGLSQRDLAARMGVVQSTVAKLEGRSQEPTLSLLDRCSRALGLRLAFNLTEMDKPEATSSGRPQGNADVSAEKAGHTRPSATGKDKRNAA
jgi:transcriptional regulator with XRE-family HTH domain